MIRIRIITALLLMSLAVLAVLAQKDQPPPPDYFPLRAEDWWKYRSTTADILHLRKFHLRLTRELTVD